jgi:hypothetical protein
MKATQKFIEDAIKGGWLWKGEEVIYDVNLNAYRTKHTPAGWHIFAIEEILLDPLAWQAVGKTRGWPERDVYYSVAFYGWHVMYHTFIDHLADGDDIETALSKLV